MRRLLMQGLVGGGLLLMSVAAYAQSYPPPPYRGDPYDRDDRAYGPPYRSYDRRGGVSPVDQALNDLNYAESNAYLSHGDRRRFDKAREELVEFQQKLYAGRFDRHELDDAIAAMQRVADHERSGYGYRNGSILWDDLQRLRDFRASFRYGGYNGNRYGPYGYPR